MKLSEQYSREEIGPLVHAALLGAGDGFVIRAEGLWKIVESTVPFGLWCYHEIKKRFDLMDDYIVVDEGGKKSFFLTAPAACQVAAAQGGPIGFAYREYFVGLLCRYRKENNLTFQEFYGRPMGIKFEEVKTL